MAEKAELKELISFVQEKGFIYGPEPEIYGGISGFYTYGPLGKLLKNRVENAIRSVFRKYSFYEVECPVVMPSKVWEASGHLGGFTDPLIKAEDGAAYRVDTLIEENCPGINIAGFSDEKLLGVIKEKGLLAPNGKKLIPEILNHSLMMRTTIGVDTEAYNRPETATTTYLPFPRYCNFFRDKFPFGVFQIGKAFRNEISPRQHVLRGREFTQAEGQLFIFDNQKNNFPKFEMVKEMKLPLWDHKSQEKGDKIPKLSLADAIQNKILKNQAYSWTLALAYELFVAMGIPEERIRLRQHHPDEMAFYADDAWDVEINLNSFGWVECCGVHDRTDYDLTQHAKFSGQELMARDENNEKKVPHVLEIAFGSDRPTFALLDIFYSKKEKDEGKTTFEIPYSLAPINVAVFPLMKKPELIKIASDIYLDLSSEFIAQYDESGAIGRRYLRQNSVGTPFCLTVDYDSLENKDVTIRDRDSGEQKRVPVDKLKGYLRDLFNKEIEFNSLP